jgi:Flp pilus assembly protein TadB
VAKQVQSEADRIAAEELANNPIAPKGHATPTRKEREAARKRPLVGGKTPEARAMSKDQERAMRERARAGMAAGEEKYLPVRDRGAQKRFIRDHVDARWGFAELTIPILGLFVLIGLVLIGLVLPGLANYVNYGLWALIVLIVIDVVVLYFSLRRRLREKFGEDRVEKIGLYHATRAIQLRPMRLPKAQVKRGQFPN